RLWLCHGYRAHADRPSFPTRRSSDLSDGVPGQTMVLVDAQQVAAASETIQLSAATEAAVQLDTAPDSPVSGSTTMTSLWQGDLRSEEHTSEIQSLTNLVCRLPLEKQN